MPPKREQIDTEALDAAAKVAAEAMEEVAVDSNILTLGSGLRLRIKPTPAWLVQRAAEAITRPTPPRIHITDQDRWEDNPSDPAYIDALALWEAKTTEAGVNVMLAMGTELVELGPDMEPPESDKWLEIVSYFGVTVDSELPIARYLTWLTCYAVPDPNEMALVIVSVQRRTGVIEEDAAKALQTFRNRAERRAANDVSAEAT